MISITVTTWGAGQLKIASSQKGSRVKYTRKSDPALAAAEAVNFSRECAQYCIFASSDVMQYIPAELRMKR